MNFSNFTFPRLSGRYNLLKSKLKTLVIKNELEKYSGKLINKKEVVAFNKCDLVTTEDLNKKMTDFKDKYKKEFFQISILNKDNISQLLRALK